MKAVFNSSPLIFLTRLDVMEEILELFHHCYIPQAVLTEISFKEDETGAYINSLIDSEKLRVLVAKLDSLSNSLNQRLGKGESEAIALAIDLEADYIILDDSVARKEALKLGLKVKGTLALIRRIHLDEKYIIDDFDKFYQKLKEINFRVKRSVFDQIFLSHPKQ